MTPQATHLPPEPRDRGLQPRVETVAEQRRNKTTTATTTTATTPATVATNGGKARKPPPPPPPMQHTSSGGSDWTTGGGASRGGKASRGSGDGESGAGRRLENRFSSWTSFGSVTQDRPARVGASAWSESVSKGGRHCCCSCVPLACGPQISGDSAEPGQAGAPETYEGNGGGSDDGGSAVGSNGGVGGESDPRRPVMGAGDAGQRRPGLTGKSGFRPRHRRGHSAGSTRIARVAQPQGWEISANGAGSGGSATTAAGSAATSTTSSNASAALAAAAAAGTAGGGGGGEGGREVVLSWGRRAGSWGAGGVAAADREFHRILKAGVDVFKHSSTRESGQWAGVLPRRLKELLSKRCPLEDENQGLVTLFLDKERENLCWCPPGAAELVPDERYRLSARSLAEVIPGDERRPRLLTLRATGRPNPLVFELDSEELYEIVSKGIVRILERNQIRDTLMAGPRNITAI